MAYNSAVRMSMVSGSLHVRQVEVAGSKIAEAVAGGSMEWEPSVKIL